VKRQRPLHAEKLSHKKEGEYNVQLLKPFLYDERFMGLLEIAVQEHDKYLVDENLARDEDLAHFSTRTDSRFPGLECQVSWLGYQEISWEPVFNLERHFPSFTHALRKTGYCDTSHEYSETKEVLE
jgi:hypothetical protein